MVIEQADNARFQHLQEYTRMHNHKDPTEERSGLESNYHYSFQAKISELHKVSSMVDPVPDSEPLGRRKSLAFVVMDSACCPSKGAA